MAQSSLPKRHSDEQTDVVTPPSASPTTAAEAMTEAKTEAAAAAAAEDESPSLPKKRRDSDIISEKPLVSGDADLAKAKASPKNLEEEQTIDKNQSNETNIEQKEKKITAKIIIIDLTIDNSNTMDDSTSSMKVVKKTGAKGGSKQPAKTGTRKARKGSRPTPARVASDKPIVTIVISDDSSTGNTDTDKTPEKEKVKLAAGEEKKPQDDKKYDQPEAETGRPTKSCETE